MSTDRATLAVIIYKVESGNVSYYGNPSKILTTSRGTFKTMANAGFVYGMGYNDSYEGQKVELTLTPAGRVTNMRKLRPADKGGLRDQVTDYHHMTQDFA